MKSRWAVMAAVAALLACHLSTLRGMATQWWNDEDMGHGFLVPVVIGWIVWNERRKWHSVPAQPSWWGVPLLISGAALHFAAVVGVGLFAASVALLLSAVGAIVCLAGFGRLRAWAFPLLLSLFMLPKLVFAYNMVTLPLQLLASRMAAGMLSASGVGVIREGNILDVGGHRVAVAEACNGIRYLLPLGFMAVVLAYVLDPKAWMRVALLVVAVPLAIVANAVRVAASAAIPALASGTPHFTAGAVIFLLCLAALAGARQLFHMIGARHYA
ncbi:MAG: exosortase/archaeosortase family protein [Bryobacteraceae bacterium]|jgi:exosortase